jgi:hypothetical protein
MMPILAAASAVLLLAFQLPAQPSVPEWSLTPELRIGGVDGPNALDVIGSIVVSPRSGDVFVAEGSRRISVFGADGSRRRTFGRRGEGPGEFQNLKNIFWSDGTLFAVDGGGTHRVTRFTEEGDVVDSRTIESGPLIGTPGGALVVAPLGSRHFLGEATRQVQAGQLVRGESRLLRMDGAGDDSILDELTHPSTFIRMLNGAAMIPIPMLPGGRYGVHPNGSAIAIVHQQSPSDDETGVFRVRKVGSDASVTFARNYAYSPRPLPRGYLDAFIDSRRPGLQRLGGSAREAERLIADHAPRFEPPVSDVRLGVEGSIWLRREAEGVDTVLWWVLDERGDLVAQLRLSRRLQIKYIDRDTVWGIEFDDLDVNYVVKYKIRR